MKNFMNTFKSDVKDLAERNGNLFTGFIVTIILLSGITAVNDPSRWWVPIVSLSGIFIAIFLFFNARAIIKALFSLFILSYIISLFFQTGSVIDSTGQLSSVWVFSVLFFYTVSLSISYFFNTSSSRWISLILSEVFFFIISYTLVTVIPYGWAIIISTLSSIGVFFMLYAKRPKDSFLKKKMPEYDAKSIDLIIENVRKSGWSFIVDEKAKEKYVLAWGDVDGETYAFSFYPVIFKQKFAASGIKKVYLSHQGRNVNPWLIGLSNKIIPSFRVKNAPIIPVIVDSKRVNDQVGKMIGVSLPDTRKRILFGVIPMKNKASVKNNIIIDSVRDFKQFLIPLTPKHVKNLEKLTGGLNNVNV